MTVDYQAAAAELDWFATKLRNVFAVTEEIRRVGSLQQVGNEAHARLDDLKRQHARAMEGHTAALDQGRVQLATLKAEIERHGEELTERRKAGNAEIEDMRKQAQQVAAEGHQQAAKILGDARLEGSALIEKAKAEHADWMAKAAATKTEYAGLSLQVSALRAEHERISAMIAELKAKF